MHVIRVPEVLQYSRGIQTVLRDTRPFRGEIPQDLKKFIL
jgi:hypothetical protein